MSYLYQIEVKHSGLNKYRIVRGRTKSETEQKANALLAEWDELWRKKQKQAEERLKREEIKLQREYTRLEHESNINLALQMTLEAEKTQKNLNSILSDSFSININPGSLKKKELFSEPKPLQDKVIPSIELPLRSDYKYNPPLTIFEKLSSKLKNQKKEECDQIYQSDFERVSKSNEEITLRNLENERMYKESLSQWEERKDAFYEVQDNYNRMIDSLITNYESGNPDAIQELIELILNSIEDPYDFERQIEVEYIVDSKILVVNQYLPIVSDLPNIKKITYVKSRSDFTESYHNASYMNKLYDDVIYNTILQTLYVIFKIDEKYNKIESIVINGKVNTIDISTGVQIEPYILTVSVKKTEFEKLNLHLIDARAWFKSSKGISASKIANITPVAPLLEMSKDDKRFVEGYSVIDDIDHSINLATIDWQDFENLIREIFEKEFNSNGGEVRITQASRDGGVDAVIFDPDPIRGGKIVIQAKRYTNVVGVSAVRDLYGTVLNEGAMKGILVTTANYGNDAYHFANGKPITLLNGANLLAMLEKHGHSGTIDLKAAKQQLAENKR